MKVRLLVFLTLCTVLSKAEWAQKSDSPLPVISKGNSQRIPHVRKKDDVSLIGRRNIGRSGLGNWYSIDDEIALGREYSSVVEANVQLLNDVLVSDYVNSIGQLLVSHSDAKVPFTIKVVDSDEVNAFSLPGGFLYVNYGVIVNAENEAELAAAMAHEIAHVAARHATRQMTRAAMLSLISLPVAFAGGGLAGQAVNLVFKARRPMQILKFPRNFEAEADYLGLEYVYAADYDPHAFISFIERVGAGEKKPGKWRGLFSTHLLAASRVQKSESEIAAIFPEHDSYVVNTSAFDEIRLHLLEYADSHEKQTARHSSEATRRSKGPGSVPRRD